MNLKIMRTIFLGLFVIISVFFISCTKSYTIGLLFVDDKDAAATTLGPAEIVDALTRMRKNAKEQRSTAPVPKWTVRKVSKNLCTTEKNEKTMMAEKDEKKLRRIVRSLSYRVDVVFDYTCERVRNVLVPFYVQNNLAVVSPYTWNMKAVSHYDTTHFFSTAIGSDTEISAMLHFLADRGIKRISVIDDGLRYSRVHTDMLMTAVQEFDITVTFRGRVLPSAHNVKSIVNHTMEQNSNALLYVGSQASAAQLVKQLRMAGYAKPIVLSRVAGGNAFLLRIGSYTDELYFVHTYPLADSTSFHVFRTWFEPLYAPLHFTRAVAETYVALEVALVLAQNGDRFSHATHSTETARHIPTNTCISTLFGDVYFDERNAMRGVYGISIIKNGVFMRYDKN